MKLLRLTYVFYLEKRYEYQRTKMDERGVWQTSSTTPIMRTFIRCNASYVLKTGGSYLEPRKSWHNHETSRAKIRIVMYQSQGHLFFYLGCGHSRSIQYHHLQAFVCLDCTNSRRGREDSSRDPKIVIWEKKQNRGVSKTRARRCVETSLLPNWLRPYSTSFYRHAVPISSTSTVCLIDIFREDYDYWVQDYRSSFQKPYIIHSSSGPPNHPHIKFIIWRSIQIINHINHTTPRSHPIRHPIIHPSIRPSTHPIYQHTKIYHNKWHRYLWSTTITSFTADVTKKTVLYTHQKFHLEQGYHTNQSWWYGTQRDSSWYPQIYMRKDIQQISVWARWVETPFYNIMALKNTSIPTSSIVLVIRLGPSPSSNAIKKIVIKTHQNFHPEQGYQS